MEGFLHRKLSQQNCSVGTLWKQCYWLAYISADASAELSSLSYVWADDLFCEAPITAAASAYAALRGTHRKHRAWTLPACYRHLLPSCKCWSGARVCGPSFGRWDQARGHIWKAQQGLQSIGVWKVVFLEPCTGKLVKKNQLQTNLKLHLFYLWQKYTFFSRGSP